MKIFSIIALSVLLASVGFVNWGSSENKTETAQSKTQSMDAETASNSEKSGEYIKAADFALRDMDGATVRLSDFRGKVVIVDFWATWCPPCVREIPHFNELTNEYGDKGFQMIGVSVDQGGKPAVVQFMEKTPIEYPVLIEEKETLFTETSFVDTDKFSEKVKQGQDKVSEFIEGKLSTEAFTNSEAFVRVLNELIKSVNLYEADRFADINLDIDVSRLEGFEPSGEQLIMFNRFLLEKAYPGQFILNPSAIYQSYLPPAERGGIPYTFVIDKEGYIRDSYVGYRDKQVFVDAIEPLL